jgi:hypothetical protein
MERKKHRLRKVLLIVFGSLIGLLILIILFLSPIVKYLVEKYDEQYTGRQITMSWAYVNPLTGYVHLHNFKFYEQKSDSAFLACSGISGHFDLRKLFSKEYVVKDLTFNDPKLIIIQLKKDLFNFTDIVEKFSKKPDDPKKDTTPVHFSLLNVKINDGIFVLREMMTPINYYIKNLDIECTGKRWNADTINTKFSFESGIGSGKVKGQFNIDTKKSTYKTTIDIKKLDLKIIEQYMKDMANYGSFRAFIDADVKAAGSFKDGRNVDATGKISISDFHFGASEKEDFASFERFDMSIKKLNPRHEKYLFDSISLVKPFAKYEKYDHLDNIQNIFGKEGENVKNTAQNPEKFNLVISIARYIKKLSVNFFHSDYKVNRIGIYNADFRYLDYSINEKFFIAANPLTIVADSVHSNKNRVRVVLNSGIKPYGDLNVSLSINPQDSSDFELNYHLDRLNTTVLNPYLVSMTSYPLDRGSIELKGNWKVKNGTINSDNHLLVIDPRISKRIKSNRNKWLPLKVVMFFARERGNAIDYHVPITGNLKDPKFHLRDIIFDVITNIFVKPATTPYSYEIKTIENRIEKTLAFNWELRSAELMEDQEKFVKKVIDFLKDNPSASIIVNPVQFTEKEKEYIAMFEAKKKFYLEDRQTTSFSEADSTNVERTSVKDSAFVKHLHTKIRDKMMFTMQERCVAYVGAKKINSKYEGLVKKREEVFRKYFNDAGLAEKMTMKSSITKVPFNGFSYYKISYNGEVPGEMREAFDKLYEFDSEWPREQFKEDRKKSRRLFNPK